LLGWRGSPETDSPISIEAKDGGGQGPCVHCAAGKFSTRQVLGFFLEVGQLRDSRWAEGLKFLEFFWKSLNLNVFSQKMTAWFFAKEEKQKIQ